MRANVNPMFVNLSRRSQTLVERQLQPHRPARGRRQDPAAGEPVPPGPPRHPYARNDESLLVSRVATPASQAAAPFRLLDVLRAAISEIEQFARVDVDSAEPPRSRLGRRDLVHLLAELIENATNFSPPDTPVMIRTFRAAPPSHCSSRSRTSASA